MNAHTLRFNVPCTTSIICCGAGDRAGTYYLYRTVSAANSGTPIDVPFFLCRSGQGRLQGLSTDGQVLENAVSGESSILCVPRFTGLKFRLEISVLIPEFWCFRAESSPNCHEEVILATCQHHKAVPMPELFGNIKVFPGLSKLRRVRT